MDRDQFIITVYCLVCEQYQALRAAQPIRRGGFAPALSDEEVLTLEICGEYFHLPDDRTIYDHFRHHYHAWFPHLSDRTVFVRQAANLYRVAAAIQQRLVHLSGQASDGIQIIDTLPLPVCVLTRAPRERCFKPTADYGYCAAKDLHYYGFKLGLRVARSGMITHCPLLPARPHDVQLLDDLVEQFVGYVPADKGFIDAFRQAVLEARHGIVVITPPRRNMAPRLPKPLYQASARLRKVIETVGSQLTGWFKIAHIRVRDVWHLQHRVVRKILAHTIGVFLNLQAGRQPLDLDGLLLR